MSDGALSQAIRTLRRALRDDPREPRFIRTVSRHGYQFVHATVIEVAEAPSPAAARVPEKPSAKSASRRSSDTSRHADTAACAASAPAAAKIGKSAPHSGAGRELRLE